MADLNKLDLSSLSPIFIFPTSLTTEEMHETEDIVDDAGGSRTYQASEARIFVGKLSQKKRAAFELRSRGVWTLESSLRNAHVNKKRKLYTESSSPAGAPSTSGDESTASASISTSLPDLETCVVVLKLSWLKKSLEAGHILPFEAFLVYSGMITGKPEVDVLQPTSSPTSVTYITAKPDLPTTDPALFERSQQATYLTNQSESQESTLFDRSSQLPIMKYSPRKFRDQKFGKRTGLSNFHPTLKHQTTSEHDFLEGHTATTSLPSPPGWMLEPHPKPNYACHRSTYADPPNAAFLLPLHKIKEARLLTLDEIGVRAYSTSIASLAAYQHVISSPAEITRLPGCNDKIATLWTEWYTSGETDTERHLSVTDALEADEDLEKLKLFFNIWGVGADTARKFYFENGWRNLDDAVEYGWYSGQLNRVQQIGVKFYDEFQEAIPRAEVEAISNVILRHARICRAIPREHWSNSENDYRGNWSKPDDGNGDKSWDPRDMVCVIVGGYRRGKPQSGDVDVILSHRDEAMTRDLVVDVISSLEADGYITHTLSLHTTTSKRDQNTLPYRAVGHAGHGFDSLDKALCVWQDPNYERDKHEKNPNIHRRVDIIISPWRTVGAAVLGWSGATTFERDIRRWCRVEKGWKFDSSGVRDRGTGEVLDLESPQENGKDEGDGWEDRERRLMEGLGIGWRPATERCTG